MGSSVRHQVPWKEVWRLYLEQQRVFEGVFADLRAKGTVISKEMATDLIHEFLVERAPYALATFHPERGNLESWLFVVFRHFVLGTYRSSQRRMNILSRWREDLAAPASDSSPELAQDLLAVEAAAARLPADEKRAITLFLGEKGGSVRAVARTLGLSRWKATRLILQGAASVVQALKVDIGVEPADLEMLTYGHYDQARILRAAAATGRSADEVRLAIKRVHEVVARLLRIQRSERGESL